MHIPHGKNIVEVLRLRARHTPEALAYEFLADDAPEVLDAQLHKLTYQQLLVRVEHLSAHIVAELEGLFSDHSLADFRGERVLLVYPAGLDFITAFYACLLIGLVPVPVPEPRRGQGLARWLHVAEDAGVIGALTVARMEEKIAGFLAQLPQSASLCFASDELQAQASSSSVEEVRALEHTALDAQSLAFLQYTSGSTSAPKGVMITHANAIANLTQIHAGFGIEPETDHACYWLPHYHDMGLIGGVLSPLYSGYPVSLMSPNSFLRQPIRWLQLASLRGATGIGAPNFAYEHCARKVSEQQLVQLDLSRLKIAFNGAEVVRQSTLDQFAQTFASTGFAAKAFYPCFGMAEATLFVTGSELDKQPWRVSVKRQDLSNFGKPLSLLSSRYQEPHCQEPQPSEVDAQSMVELVACGRAVPGMDIQIVDPQTHCAVTAPAVGEIWIAGDNVAAGYWQRSETNAESFNQRVLKPASEDKAPINDKRYFRTGDLGFVSDGELFVTGRIKDLIVIRGVNYYPADIGESAEQACNAITANGIAAFGIEFDGQERLAVVCEIERTSLRKLDTEAAILALRERIAKDHLLQVAAISLVKPGVMPRTPSGKVQHFAAKNQWQNDELKPIASWCEQGAQQTSQQTAQQTSQQTSANTPAPGTLAKACLAQPQRRREGWLIAQIQTLLASTLQLPLSSLQDPDVGFFDLGIESIRLVELKDVLEQQLGFELIDTVFFEYPSVAKLAEFIVLQLCAGEITAEEPQANNNEKNSQINNEKNSQKNTQADTQTDSQSDTVQALSDELDALTALLEIESH